jgi:hypothetical protein
MIEHFEIDKKDYKKEKEKHMKMLEEIAERGKRHSKINKG